MTKDGKPKCGWCDADLIEDKWNLEVNILYCTASGCEKFRHPQMKRYLDADDPAGGRLETSKWILAGIRGGR
jgi:hypothetical protein